MVLCIQRCRGGQGGAGCCSPLNDRRRGVDRKTNLLTAKRDPDCCPSRGPATDGRGILGLVASG